MEVIIYTEQGDTKKFLVLIIVFAKNEKIAVVKTLESLSEALVNMNYSFKVVYVDDFSQDETIEHLNLAFNQENRFFDILKKNDHDSPGIKSCLKKAIDNNYSDQILALPGHFMFDTDAISQVLQNIKPNSVIIGQRVNLYSSRPFVKYISANLFRLLFFVTFKTTKIKDPHGLNSYPTKVFINALPFMKSHENHLVPLAFSIKNSLEIINIPIRVREQHKKENNRRGVPKFRDIIDSSHNLLLARKILKSSNSYT